MSDPRPFLYQALNQAAVVVAGIGADQAADATPCSEFDVQTLVGHVVGVGRQVASVGRGEPQESDVMVTGLRADKWATAFGEARQEALASWSDGVALGQEIVLSWATLPGVVFAQVYALELTTHAWDLAEATGQIDRLDPVLAESALPIAHQMVPLEGRDAMPFAAAVSVPDDAGVYDRLVAYLGREPR